MVGKKTFRCLLFSLSDVAKMVKKVDVSIPSCIQRVIDGEVSDRCFLGYQLGYWNVNTSIVW